MSVAIGDPRLPPSFWRRVSVDPETGCWTWIGYVSVYGYGLTTVRRVTRRAHRVSYAALVGPIPDGLYMDHLCKQRSCVNPAHLEPVTPRENVLRGVGWPAMNVLKTSCPAGHPYEGSNLRVARTGKRHCRACDAIRCVRRRARAKEVA